LYSYAFYYDLVNSFLKSKGGILAKAYEYILELQQKSGISQGHYDKDEVELLIQERNNFKNEVSIFKIVLVVANGD
jgi:hypothetical protein